MFESLLGFREIEKSPWKMFLWAFALASIAVLISSQIAYRVEVLSGVWFNLSGLFAVLFAIIPSAYFFTTMIKREERIEEDAIKRYHKCSFWERHGEYIMISLIFFAGLSLAFAFWSFVLPEDFFQVQSSKISQIHGTSGAFTQGDFGSFVGIFVNNMQVMVFALLFSLFFGAGAVFIIAWNASILGVYISQLSKHVLEIPWWSIFFLPHGIPEIGGYLCAGLAGGLVSAAVLRKNDQRVLRIIILDSIKILVIGVVLIFIGAAIEVYL